MRDPRIDPRPGDIVATRTVTRRRGYDIYYVRAGREKSCWITTWMEWCRHKEVLHVAGE